MPTWKPELFTGKFPWVAFCYKDTAGGQFAIGGGAGSKEQVATARVFNTLGDLRYANKVERKYHNDEVKFGASEIMLGRDDVLLYCEFVDDVPMPSVNLLRDPSPAQLWEAAEVILLIAKHDYTRILMNMQAAQQAQQVHAASIRDQIVAGNPMDPFRRAAN